MLQQHPYSSPARPATNDAFSVVMRAQAYGRTSPAVDFSEVLAEFQQSLGEDDGTSGEAAWGAKISQTITKMVHEKVVPQATDKYAHIDTRINALHLLIDTAMGVAYAPSGIASDSVRSGTAPRMIVLAIYEVLSKMTEMDIRRMGKDEVAFLDKVTELRLRPRESCNNTATWKDLDDILRLLGYPGTVNFRVVFGNFKYCIENGFSSVVRAHYMRTGKNANSDYVVRIIRNSIVAYVSPSSCFETKINALNALADIGICEMDGGPWGDEEGTAERYLCNTIFDVAKMLSEKEVAIVTSDMRYLKPEMSPEHSDSLDYSPRSPHHDTHRILVRGLSLNNLKGTSLGIFAKILYLRWIQRACSDRWQRCLTTLDNVIDLFIDSSGSVPLRCDRLRESVRRAFAEVESVASSPGRRETAASEAKTVVESTIERLAKRGSPELVMRPN
ncbi:hypothetical protein HYALB_00012773 [Hymenoscyphus albidus]|uniref:Uncharacterized protein n=1 Tax=Hymenoscyphus albidus TaxID=595503 RepID=A0A9N9LV64_9HELO|nr:hypothetical protein HYALB_00012773 [Hymenoscyphus albidus]